ncbi:MAG: hypothetical protein ACOCV7_02740 [Desulfonatronovibrionaceae bacterium]
MKNSCSIYLQNCKDVLGSEKKILLLQAVMSVALCLLNGGKGIEKNKIISGGRDMEIWQIYSEKSLSMAISRKNAQKAGPGSYFYGD